MCELSTHRKRSVVFSNLLWLRLLFTVVVEELKLQIITKLHILEEGVQCCLYVMFNARRCKKSFRVWSLLSGVGQS